MKVNDEFYQTANSKLEQVVKDLESDIDEFKKIIDLFLGENEFGIASTPIETMSNDMYISLSGILEGLASNVLSCTDDYIVAVNNDDSLY